MMTATFLHVCFNLYQAKDTYYSRCQEFEKVRKETTNAKDIEKVRLQRPTSYTIHVQYTCMYVLYIL